jgi:hypothetical protein
MSYLLEATLNYLDEKSNKEKKTKEPRWQDSDGDGKWYEPGQDVKVKKEDLDMDLFDMVMEHLLSNYEGLDEETAMEVMSDLDEDEINHIHELYKGKHGQSDSEYQADRSDAGKRISGDDKQGPASYTSRWYKGSPTTAPGAKPVNTPKVSKSELDYARTRHNDVSGKDWNKMGGSKGLPK